MAEVVSGVGNNARRTDMNTSSKLTQAMQDRIPSNSYGDQVQLNQIQSGADLQGQAYKVPKLTTPMPLPNNEPTVPFTQDTLRPDEPSEFGMPFGAGPGPEILVGQQPIRTKPSDTVYDIMINTNDGEAQALYEELRYLGL
jgi:hypothetical protein